MRAGKVERIIGKCSHWAVWTWANTPTCAWILSNFLCVCLWGALNKNFGQIILCSTGFSITQKANLSINRNFWSWRTMEDFDREEVGEGAMSTLNEKIKFHTMNECCAEHGMLKQRAREMKTRRKVILWLRQIISSFTFENNQRINTHELNELWVVLYFGVEGSFCYGKRENTATHITQWIDSFMQKRGGNGKDV